MLALDQVAAHVQPLRRGHVAGLLEIAHDQAGQQAQAERMVAVRLARPFDLGVRAADALGAEERHGIGGLHLFEFFFAERFRGLRIRLLRERSRRAGAQPRGSGCLLVSARFAVGSRAPHRSPGGS